MSSSTSTIPTPSPTETGTTTNGGGPNSPLLFFVALGFGVVFTNLWIIVGVKYCFRYNQRNRARLAGEDPDGVDLAAMPQRRRRREKKLMSIDEVNDKFPLIKYKTWRANRAEQGLPTTGGIVKGASRPASLLNIPRDTEDNVMAEKNEPASPSTTVPVPVTTSSPQKPEPQQNLSEFYASPHSPVSTTDVSIHPPEPAVVRRASDNAGDDDTDQIRMAIPPEQLPEMGGDTCAICIDTIEEEDDIRGLTCGHAFHASCVDPWLTSRRACCPLCKADYYVPKPRPEGAPNETRRVESASTPFSIISGGRPGYRRGRSRIILPGVFFSPTNEPRTSGTQGNTQRSRRQTRQEELSTQTSQPQPQPEPDTSSQSPEITQQAQSSWRQRIRLPSLPALSRIRTGRGTQTGSHPTAENNNDNPPPTPSQLEAGAR